MNGGWVMVELLGGLLLQSLVFARYLFVCYVCMCGW